MVIRCRCVALHCKAVIKCPGFIRFLYVFVLHRSKSEVSSQ